MTHVTIISGGLREHSSTRLLADRIALALGAEAESAELKLTSTVIELRPLAMSITQAMLAGYPSDELQEAFETLSASDGMVAVTPAFNASFSGLFKSFFDVLPEESLSDMPVMMAATGGTDRHSLVLEHAMRPMFSYLHALVSPAGVYAATEDFGTTAASSPLNQRISKATSDFIRLLNTCGPRERRNVWDEELSTMERLLNPSADHEASS